MIYVNLLMKPHSEISNKIFKHYIGVSLAHLYVNSVLPKSTKFVYI